LKFNNNNTNNNNNKNKNKNTCQSENRNKLTNTNNISNHISNYISNSISNSISNKIPKKNSKSFSKSISKKILYKNSKKNSIKNSKKNIAVKDVDLDVKDKNGSIKENNIGIVKENPYSLGKSQVLQQKAIKNRVKISNTEKNTNYSINQYNLSMICAQKIQSFWKSHRFAISTKISERSSPKLSKIERPKNFFNLNNKSESILKKIYIKI